MNERVAATLREDSTMARHRPARPAYDRARCRRVRAPLYLHREPAALRPPPPRPSTSGSWTCSAALRHPTTCSPPTRWLCARPFSGTKVEYLREAAAGVPRRRPRPHARGVRGTRATRRSWPRSPRYAASASDRPDVPHLRAGPRGRVLLGDLAVRKDRAGVQRRRELTRAEMRNIGDAWRPYRSYGTRYVWAE